jgi:hypothetical protein
VTLGTGDVDAVECVGVGSTSILMRQRLLNDAVQDLAVVRDQLCSWTTGGVVGCSVATDQTAFFSAYPGPASSSHTVAVGRPFFPDVGSGAVVIDHFSILRESAFTSCGLIDRGEPACPSFALAWQSLQSAKPQEAHYSVPEKQTWIEQSFGSPHAVDRFLFLKGEHIWS